MKIAWVKEFGRQIILTFKLWLTALVSVLVLSIVLGTTLLFFLPLPVRLTLLGIYVLVSEIMMLPFVRMIAGSTGVAISNFRYNKKHKPKERYLKNAKQIAKKMNMKYNKPIYVTHNPTVTGPFTNLLSCKIYFPSSDIEARELILHEREKEFTFAHELAHIKYAPRFIGEMLLTSLATCVFAIVLAQFAINLTMFVFAEFAFMMLTSSFVMRRNESRADWAAGRATSPEAGVAALEYYEVKVKGDGGWITHPSFRGRKKQLERLFDPDNQ
jgi:Zn-dependent protease with chaperone function